MCVSLCVCCWGGVRSSTGRGRPGRGQMITNTFVFVFVKEDVNCNVLHVCVPTKFTSWNPHAQSDGFRKWGLWEVIRL